MINRVIVRKLVEVPVAAERVSCRFQSLLVTAADRDFETAKAVRERRINETAVREVLADVAGFGRRHLAATGAAIHPGDAVQLFRIRKDGADHFHLDPGVLVDGLSEVVQVGPRARKRVPPERVASVTASEAGPESQRGEAKEPLDAALVVGVLDDPRVVLP